MHESDKPQKTKRKGLVGGLLGLIALLLIASIVIANTGSKPKYQASTTGFSVVNPATVSVGLRVKNVGNASGTPNCTVDVQGPSATYTGANEGTLSMKLKPGQTSNSAMSVTVSKQGAKYISSATVSCN